MRPGVNRYFWGKETNIDAEYAEMAENTLRGILRASTPPQWMFS